MVIKGHSEGDALLTEKLGHIIIFLLFMSLPKMRLILVITHIIVCIHKIYEIILKISFDDTILNY